MKQAVFSFFPTCEYSHEGWWGYFPRFISERLQAEGVEHKTYYWRYARDLTPETVVQRHVSVEDLGSVRWVAQHIVPETRAYDRVIFHHHGFPVHTALWRARMALPSRSLWVMTDHFAVTSRSSDRLGCRLLARQLMRTASLLPEVLICVSEANRRRLSHLYGAWQTVSILNGIRIPEMPRPALSHEKPRRALYVGRLVREKGLFVLLDAMRMAKEQGHPLELTILGLGPDKDAVQLYIQQHQLMDTVRFVGPQSDPFPFYQNSDFIVIPSIWEEPCPLVSMESQACYLPGIYTDRGGLPETQVQGETGLMIPSNNPGVLLRAMLDLHNNPTLHAQMRLNARKNVENHFSVERMAIDYARLYMDLFIKLRKDF